LHTYNFLLGVGVSDLEAIYRALKTIVAQPKYCPFELNTTIDLKEYNYIQQ